MIRVVAILCLLATSGCAEIPLVFCPLTLVEPGQPRLVSRSRGEAPVIVMAVWKKTRAEVVARCGEKDACAQLWKLNGVWHCEIVAIEPRDFNDFQQLELLGHEAWHCLGARHE